MADKSRIIRIQLLGLPNPADTNVITVNGIHYEGSMSNQGGNDSEIAAVLTFERTLLNGATDYISVSKVAQVRDSLVARCKVLNDICTPDTAHN